MHLSLDSYFLTSQRPSFPFWVKAKTAIRLLLSCFMTPREILPLLPAHPWLSHRPDSARVLDRKASLPPRPRGLRIMLVSKVYYTSYACPSYLVLFYFRPLPHGCLPLMSFPHLAWSFSSSFSSSCFSICNSVPEPLLFTLSFVQVLRESHCSLDPKSRITAPLATFNPSSHSTSPYVRASINSYSNVPILLAFSH